MCIGDILRIGGATMSSQMNIAAAKAKEVELNQEAGQLRAQASDERSIGRAEAERRLTAGAQLQGEQKTAFAASGVRVDSGSPLDIMADTEAAANLDADTIQLNAARSARVKMIDARNLRKMGRAGTKHAYANVLPTILGSGATFDYGGRGGQQAASSGAGMKAPQGYTSSNNSLGASGFKIG